MDDRSLIKEIEKQIQIPLQEMSLEALTEDLYEYIQGYTLDDAGHVIGLRLVRIRFNDGDILGRFEHLQTLVLWYTLISDFQFLKSLNNLKSLYLTSKNKIKNYSFLQGLQSLTTLNLAGNNIMDISYLQSLQSLKTLYLGGNNITDISYLRYLQSLTTLDLGRNKITDISYLRYLQSLTTLGLGSNNIMDISFLRYLNFLTTLNLDFNNITDISFLQSLQSLTTLNLRSNKITDISYLQGLNSLTSLDLWNNSITNISYLQGLQSLATLNLGGNNITDISFLQGHKSLTTLKLWNNNITDISFLRGLKSLTTLDLSRNNITDYSYLQGLQSLTTLNLSSNNIADISFLRNLNSLTTLNLRNNKIADLSAVAGLINLDRLEVGNNPVEIPPPEIVKEGLSAIRNYFEQVKEQGGLEKLYETKVAIVGEAGSGKTTLFEKLQNPLLVLPETKSSLGVEVKEGYTFLHPLKENVEITANIWDFGGQEIQYQLHQYFITPDSLYILVADNRSQHTRWDYWFQIISLLGGACPVLVILNNNKTYSEKDNFPIDKCRTNFGDLVIETRKIDFSKNDADWDELQQKIKIELSKLPLVNEEVPKLWKPLRAALVKERKEANYISIDRFFELCPPGLDKEEHRLAALSYFHRIGIVLHFSGDTNLRDIVFLNPNWITQGLYAALAEGNDTWHNGCFSEEWINKYWANHRNKYKYKERTYLLRLMLKDNFDICYSIGNDKYIVPMLLPVKKPDYQWNYSENLGYRIQYPFMPAGVISRLFVRLNEMIDNNLIWLDGVILDGGVLQCKAQIIQKKDTKSGLMFIDIHIRGGSLRGHKELLSKIRETIYRIHETSFTNIPFTELVVCNCTKCLTHPEPAYFDIDTLKEYIAEPKYEIECRKLKGPVSINQLLGLVYSDEELKSMVEGIMYKKDSGSDDKLNGSSDVKRQDSQTALRVLLVSFMCLIITVIVLSMVDKGLVFIYNCL